MDSERVAGIRKGISHIVRGPSVTPRETNLIQLRVGERFVPSTITYRGENVTEAKVFAEIGEQLGLDVYLIRSGIVFCEPELGIREDKALETLYKSAPK